MPGDAEYTVQPGDTLSAIAAKNNATVEQLIGLNNIVNPRLIYPGNGCSFVIRGRTTPKLSLVSSGFACPTQTARPFRI